MELTAEELSKVHSMLNSYKVKYKEIKNLEKTLETLNTTRDQIKKQLEDIRESENDFGKYLIKKYGKGKFNVQTFEYELEEQK